MVDEGRAAGLTRVGLEHRDGEVGEAVAVDVSGGEGLLKEGDVGTEGAGDDLGRADASGAPGEDVDDVVRGGIGARHAADVDQIGVAVAVHVAAEGDAGELVARGLVDGDGGVARPPGPPG